MTNQGLSAGNANASASAHTNIRYVRNANDHTACPAVASGYGGYTSTPFSGGHSTAYQSNLCALYLADWAPNPVNAYLHGAVFNPNASTFDYIYYADYYWWT